MKLIQLSKRTTLALIAGSSLFIAAAANAYPGGYGGKGGGMMGGDSDFHMRHMERMADRLKLTDEQRETMKSMRDQRREQHLEMRDEMREIHTQLKELTLSDKLDRKEAEKLTARLGEITQKMALDRVVAKQGFYASLTEEQQQEMADMVAEREKRWEQKREKWEKRQDR